MTTIVIDCLNCNGKIIETDNGFKCENTFNNTCHISVPKIIAQKQLSNADITDLIQGKTTCFIDGFIAKSGKNFSAKLYIDEKDYKIKFDSSVTSCPKCQTGNLIAFEKAFSCSNYKSETPCNFSVWKKQNGGEITIENIIELSSKKQTNQIIFSTKDGNNYNGILKLNTDFTVVLQKS